MPSVFARAAALALLLSSAACAQEGAGDVVFVPTPQIVVERMLQMAKVGPSDFIIDLGSGDGRMVITAAKKFGARGFGVDLDDVLLERSNSIAKAEGVADRAQFRKENLFETDLSSATVITTYLLPEMNEKLRPKILKLKPGTRVVAHDYHMGDWYPDENDTLIVPEKTVGSPGKSFVYLWIVPANAAGTWQAKVTGQNITVDLVFDQIFQMLNGSARLNGKVARVQGGRLRGNDVTFWVVTEGPIVRHEFNGRINGDIISGTVTIHSDKESSRRAGFTATRSAPGNARLSALDARGTQ